MRYEARVYAGVTRIRTNPFKEGACTRGRRCERTFELTCHVVSYGKFAKLETWKTKAKWKGRDEKCSIACKIQVRRQTVVVGLWIIV